MIVCAAIVKSFASDRAPFLITRFAKGASRPRRDCDRRRGGAVELDRPRSGAKFASEVQFLAADLGGSVTVVPENVTLPATSMTPAFPFVRMPPWNWALPLTVTVKLPNADTKSSPEVCVRLLTVRLERIRTWALPVFATCIAGKDATVMTSDVEAPSKTIVPPADRFPFTVRFAPNVFVALPNVSEAPAATMTAPSASSVPGVTDSEPSTVRAASTCRADVDVVDDDAIVTFGNGPAAETVWAPVLLKTTVPAVGA